MRRFAATAAMAVIVATQSGCLLTMTGRAVQRNRDRQMQFRTQAAARRAVRVDVADDGAGGVQYTAGVSVLDAWAAGSSSAPFWSWPTVLAGAAETAAYALIGRKNGWFDSFTGDGGGDRESTPTVAITQTTGAGDNTVVVVVGAGTGTSTSSGHNAPAE